MEAIYGGRCARAAVRPNISFLGSGPPAGHVYQFAMAWCKTRRASFTSSRIIHEEKTLVEILVSHVAADILERWVFLSVLVDSRLLFSVKVLTERE